MSCVIGGMGATVHCESFLSTHSSMGDPSDDFNSCSWSVYRGDANLRDEQYHNGLSLRAASDLYSGYDRHFMKQTMLEHEAVFKNQVHELHRLYRIQRNLVDGVKGKNLNEDMNGSDSTYEIAIKRQLPELLLANSTYGEGSSSRACKGHLQNGVSSKDVGVFEVRPLKVKRKMIDLQLPADEYLDTDETGDTAEITICPPYKLSKSGKGDASHQSNSSGSCLDVKNSNGLADLNEPLKWQEPEPVALSRNMYYQLGRNNADLHGQWLEKNRSQNGWMVLKAGHDRSTQRDQLRLPSHSVQVLSNSAFQPQSYLTTDHSKVKLSGGRAYGELEVRSKNPQASYDSYMESSLAFNAPRLHNDYRPDFVKPWSHCSSSWENPMSSSYRKSFPVQTNPFMNFDIHAREGSNFEMRSRVTNEHYQGLSSGSKAPSFNFPSASFKSNASLAEEVKSQPFESLQGPKKQECSAGLPWLKPKPVYKSEISNGWFDLNADTGDDLTSASPQKGLRSVSCSANMRRIEMIDPRRSTKISCKEAHMSLVSHSLCIADQHKEVDQVVKRDLDINLPCDASVSDDQNDAKALCVHKKEGGKAANFRQYIDLNSCANEDDADFGLHSSLRVKTKATTWIDLEASPTLESEEDGESLQEKTNDYNELVKVAAQAIVAISLSEHQCHPDDRASSSTDAALKSPLSWFADIIASRGNELERKVDGSHQTPNCEGYREEYSSGEIDYFEAKTLSLQQMKEVDYMPEPLVSGNMKFEGTGYNQPRRGQARRGRPKRDFQRDILPGLSSLSRHEITEDIQMFGGLMKTRDYSWNSGVAGRRNSKRKRLVSNVSQAPVSHPVALPVVGLEDSKLTGWGKATRRPRRQRCPPAGNPATVILT